MNEPRKTQPKSSNFIAAIFTEVLSWRAYGWDQVKTETILSGVEKCYVSVDPGERFEVEVAPEAMEIEVSKDKVKKEKKNIIAVKSKSVAELQRLATKKERARKKFRCRRSAHERNLRSRRIKTIPSGKQRRRGSPEENLLTNV